MELHWDGDERDSTKRDVVTTLLTTHNGIQADSLMMSRISQVRLPFTETISVLLHAKP